MKKIALFFVAYAMVFQSCKNKYSHLKDGLYAKLMTSKGDIMLSLEFEKVPITVGNFIGLAEGTLENSSKAKGVPYYDGVKFHRVIKDFMIQTGDPTGTGSGGPGYKFADEVHLDLKHDKAGVLSMANSGVDTNGSQFFITHKATPWLDGKHSVFGSVVDSISQNVVDSIAKDDSISKIEIIRIGEKAKKFDGIKIFKDALEKFKKEQEELRKKEREDAEKFKDQAIKWSKNAKTTKSGLKYVILKKGKGKKAKKNSAVKVHYSLKLENGKKIDSSYDRKQPISIKIGVGQVIKGWDEGVLLLREGSKAVLIVPPHLGYGESGAGGVIPPNATLYFEVELIEVK